jgi:HAMP domain-containing protein
MNATAVLALTGALVAALALLLVLLWWQRALRRLAGTVREVAAGSQAAISTTGVPGPVRDVARAVTALMAESQRLRAAEAESRRLRSVARETGFRIREHLRVKDLLEEARFAIEQNAGADAAHLHVISDSGISLPVGHEHDSLLPANFADLLLPPSFHEDAEELLRAQSSLVVQDVNGADGYRLEFFATVAHELRASLTAIDGYAEMITQGEAGQITPEQGRMLTAISRRSVQLRSLIDDLLTLSKLETGTALARLQRVDLAQVMSDAADATAPAAAGGLTLTTTPAPAAHHDPGRQCATRPRPAEPALQRRQVHPARRSGPAAGQRHGQHGHHHGRRYRHRHPSG